MYQNIIANICGFDISVDATIKTEDDVELSDDDDDEDEDDDDDDGDE